MRTVNGSDGGEVGAARLYALRPPAGPPPVPRYPAGYPDGLEHPGTGSDADQADLAPAGRLRASPMPAGPDDDRRRSGPARDPAGHDGVPRAAGDRDGGAPVIGGTVRELLGATIPTRMAGLDPGRPGLKVLLVVGLLAALAGGVYAWRARPEPEPLPPPLPVAAPSRPPASPTPVARVMVHVAGKVRRPGLVALPGGSRVADALAAAGGVRPGASAGPLNLARRVIDGEQIMVGVTAGPAGSEPITAGPGAATGGVLDLNAATTDQLETLPGVGEVLAARIAEFRTRHSGFRSVDQLREVPGIGERKFAELRDKVTV
ncbi:hypothetical protein Sru01_32950 [Sphaerisporangium rufum]|uniref:Helix-hairpin-helix DNA-binding motif class 1 domain-containing protein n=1 Tax=Sphaerisporangium rufum TaxID=1381558 RepID=A0A919V1X9_9ACTN|nr:ComEA family DNA-binding protein [Sphaerisporangium rufum]GII78313.1 hypothetical protein Sru01_32950 [Sphaerisporangium rufum]